MIKRHIYKFIINSNSRKLISESCLQNWREPYTSSTFPSLRLYFHFHCWTHSTKKKEQWTTAALGKVDHRRSIHRRLRRPSTRRFLKRKISSTKMSSSTRIFSMRTLSSSATWRSVRPLLPDSPSGLVHLFPRNTCPSRRASVSRNLLLCFCSGTTFYGFLVNWYWNLNVCMCVFVCLAFQCFSNWKLITWSGKVTENCCRICLALPLFLEFLGLRGKVCILLWI